MAQHITHDPIYDTVDRDDFAAMIAVGRYAERSNAFDSIISATEDHFWDPLDPRYVDYAPDFDLENETLLPREMVVELHSAVADRLDERQKVRLANQNARFMISSILHGEQGALSLSASLCQILREPGAQEYAANQAREEARHVTAFSRYVTRRWGTPLRSGPTLAALLDEVVRAPEVYKKLIGMQMLVEGLAMGAFAHGFQYNRAPLARKLFELVMTDEAFHHKFGKILADRTIPHLTGAERAIVEDWTAHCAQKLFFDRGAPNQMAEMFVPFGLDPERVTAAIVERQKARDPNQRIRSETNIFRVLIKTLLKAGLITERTRAFYAAYVDLEELAGEGDRMIGDDIAEDGIRYLQEINFKDRARSQVSVAAE